MGLPADSGVPGRGGAVGVWSSVVCRGPEWVWVDQPGVSLVWLQAWQRPWPLVAVVVPLWCQGVMWSRWRMGASQ